MEKDNEIEVHLISGPHARVRADKKRTFRDFESEHGRPTRGGLPAGSG